MIIVIEGIDRVGKTTLCNKLQAIGFQVFKDDFATCVADSTNEEKSLMATSSMNTLINFMKLFQNDVAIVLDRFHATEFVYGYVERNVNFGNALQRFCYIEKELEKLGEDYLYVFVEPTDIDWSIEKHGGNLREHEALFEVIFEQMISEKNKMKVNYNTLDEVISSIKK